MVSNFGPYSSIMRAGNFYFVAGQVGVSLKNNEVSSDIEEQTKQALENLTAVLESEGLEIQDVVKTTVFLTNMDDFEKMNTVYFSYFGKNLPARSTVGVNELPRVGSGKSILKIEIEAIAHKNVSRNSL